MSDGIASHVILVDSFDNEVGSIDKLKAHQLGLLHRAFSVFVFRKSSPAISQYDELLIHQRHPDKYHSGGLWTNTCCSHPKIGEKLQQAAQKRLFEEMGIQLKLKHVGQFIYRAECSLHLIEHEYDHVFVGFDQGEAFTPNPVEVLNWKWVNLTHLKHDLSKNPKLYTVWFKSALEVAENVGLGRLKPSH